MRSRNARARKRNRIIRITAVVLVVLVLVGAGAAWAYVNDINGNLSGNVDDATRNALVKTDLTREPFYMLLMGTDESLERENDAEYAGSFRSDTLILARIDPVNKQVTLVSIPRDTKVDLGEYGINKINTCTNLGGPALAIDTVSDLSGVGISHFATVNFDGFREVVDALGGIEVDVPMEIDDYEAAGHLMAGPQTLNGEQALVLCRARHAYDDYGAGDIFRAANQRLVLAAIANKILDSDVATIANTVSALSKSVSTDLSVNDIIGLAQAFQGFDSANSMYTAALPTTSSYEDDLWYELVDTAAWQTMMKRVDQGLPPTDETIVDSTGVVLATTGDAGGGTAAETTTEKPVKHTGTVAVRNGSITDGAATSVGGILTGQGYTVSDVGNADNAGYAATLVVYNDTAKADEAKNIAKTIGVGSVQFNDGSFISDYDFLVVIGADYRS